MTEKPWRRAGYLEGLPDVKRNRLAELQELYAQPDNVLSLTAMVIEPDVDVETEPLISGEELFRTIAMTAILLVVTILLLVGGAILHAKLSTTAS